MSLITKLLKGMSALFRKVNPYYKINWKNQEQVLIPEWLKDQLVKHKDLLLRIVQDNKWDRMGSDRAVIEILKWVQKYMYYKSDILLYKTVEYWASVEETIQKLEGDCEDAAALIFCLARTAGVGADQIFLVTGEVENPNGTGLSGHAWIRYVSKAWPFSAMYLDSVYYYTPQSVRSRPYYSDSRKKWGIRCNSPVFNKYRKIWFFANEVQGYKWR